MATRIAVIEDEPALRDNLRDALTRHGYEVQTFAGGRLKGALYQQGEQYWMTLAERDKLEAEQLPGRADWAYRIEQYQYRALAVALKEALAKKQ